MGRAIKINKKGLISEADKGLFWIIMLIFIGLIVAIAVAWTASLRQIFVNNNVEPTVYEARVLYSPNCFAYKDDTGRVYTGVIDIERFNEQVLRECVPLVGTAKHAMAAEIRMNTSNMQYVDFIESQNWGLNAQKVTMTKYFVYVYDHGLERPAILTFFHKAGSD